MGKNKCRNCDFSMKCEDVHSLSLEEIYGRCILFKKNKEVLRSCLFTEGEQITTIEELLKQEWIWLYNVIRNIKEIKHMKLHVVLTFLECEAFRKAIRKEMLFDEKAREIKNINDGFLRNGFTEQQAIELTKTVLKAAISGLTLF